MKYYKIKIKQRKRTKYLLSSSTGSNKSDTNQPLGARI